MSSDAETLLIRAINASRQGFFPAYAGLRIATASATGSAAHAVDLATSRLAEGPICRLRPYQQYKGTDPISGQHEYRACMATSPLTSLTEAVVLSMLAGQESFSIPLRAYSYHWPHSAKTGASFDFFATRYNQRNRDIAGLLGPDDVATVVDVRRFYPSVGSAMILSTMERRLVRSALSPVSQKGVLSFTDTLLRQGGGGLPIGPALSHFLGHVAVETIDEALTAQFGDRYFRYVDDIIIVTSRSGAAAARDAIARAVADARLELNEDKNAELDANQWQIALQEPDVAEGDSFGELVKDLTLWLAYNDVSTEALVSQCRGFGVALPLTRLQALSRYTRFQRFAQVFKSPKHWWRTAYLTRREFSSFLERARTLKSVYQAAFDRQAEALRAAQGVERRWPLQRLRRVTNPLFYLRTFEEWRGDLGVLDGIPELQEQAALARSLADGTPLPVLQISAKAVAAFCDLWIDYGSGHITLEQHLFPLGLSSEEGVCTLRLYDLLAPISVDACEEASSLFQAVGSARLHERIACDFSFDDELESLRLPYSAEELAHLVRSRYSEREDAGLAALRLSGSRSAS